MKILKRDDKEVGLMDKVIYIKYIWSVGKGNMSIPIELAQTIIGGGVFAKLFGLNVPLVIGVLGVSFVVITLFLGYHLMKRGFVERENDFMNRFNPTLMDIWKRDKNKDKP